MLITHAQRKTYAVHLVVHLVHQSQAALHRGNLQAGIQIHPAVLARQRQQPVQSIRQASLSQQVCLFQVQLRVSVEQCQLLQAHWYLT